VAVAETFDELQAHPKKPPGKIQHPDDTAVVAMKTQRIDKPGQQPTQNE